MTKPTFVSHPLRPLPVWSALSTLALVLVCSSGPALAQPAGGTSSPAAQLRQADFIVAVVNSEPITNQDVRARLQRVEAQTTRQGNAAPREQLIREVLERLILERAQLQLARQAGVRSDDAAVDQAVADVARQNQLSVDELQRRLSADGLTLSRFREDIRDELTLNRLRDREVDSRVKVSEQEIDQFLAAQKDAVGVGPLSLRLGHILVAVPEDATPEQVTNLQSTAQGIVQRLRAGADFASLARSSSASPEKEAGGDLGLRPADRYPPLFVEATQGQPVGALVGPVRSGAGFHVLKVLEKKQGDAIALVTQTRARHILLRTGPRLSENAARQQLAQFKRRVEAEQADFASLAREFSDDGSAKQGGDLGWASPGMFVPEFEQTMNRLAPGQIADPLVSRFGVHLIQVLERRQMEMSERERRDAAKAQVREKKVEEALQTWLQDVRGRAYVEFREPPQ